MAQSLNKVQLIGRLGQDPEMRYTPSGKAVATFSMATDNSFTGADGVKVQRTDWHSIQCWGKLAEIVTQYAKKGRLVYVEGRILYDQWVDTDGQKRNRTKINISQLVFLESGANNVAEEAEEETPLTF